MQLTHPLKSAEPGGQQSFLRRCSTYFAIFVLAIAIPVLAGWGIEVLSRPLPLLTAMDALTALNFLFAGTSFLLLSPSRSTRSSLNPLAGKRITIGLMLAGVVLLIGMLTAAGPLLGFHRQADHTAFCFILSGLSLFLLNRTTKGGYQLCQLFALLIAWISLFSLIGYLYRLQHTFVAAQAAGCFLLLSMALLLAHPGSGIMKDLTGVGKSSVAARSLLLLVIFLPVVLGYLRLLAYWKGRISTELSLAALVSGIILAFSIIVWFTTSFLNKRDEQKQSAEGKLQESELRFELLVDTVKDYAIFMLDPSGRIISWNEGAERIKGYKKEEIIGRNISVFYTPAEIARGEPHYNLSQARLYGHFEQEGERVRKDGSVFWANVLFTALHDPDGRLLGFAKVTRDITERRRSEEQITYMAQLMEDTSDAIFSTDTSFVIRTWNKAAELLFGYPLAEVKGKAAREILRTQMAEEVIADIQEKMLRTGYWKGEVYYMTKAGTVLTILLSASGIKNSEGRSEGFVMVCRDFTERKKLELQLEQFNRELEEQVKKKTAELTDYKYALDQSSIVSITDEKGVIKYVNDNFCSISGYTTAELIGYSHSIVGTQYHPPEFFRNMWQRISKGEVWKGEIRNRAKDGSIYWVDMTIIPFLNAKGEPYEFIALDSDITERKNAEGLLGQSYQDIRQLASHLQDIREEERAGIAREIHDELGQQLTGLKMDFSWMSKRKAIQEDNELRQKAVIVMSLLDTTIKTVRRIATELRPSILDDLGLVAAIEWQCQEFERRSGIRTEFTSTLTDFGCSSSTAIGLFRICQESMTNAARHAAARRIRISLQEEENEYILLKIEDDGKGFEAQTADNKKTLGLLGMNERALMMGGEFRIESEPGKGTTLFVTVPVSTTIG